MPDTVKRVNVRIAGVAYQLAATEDETHIRKMAAQADEMIRQVLLASPHLSQSMATILALVNAMDEVNKFRRQSETLQKEKDSLTQQTQQFKTELDRVREQNWDMRKDQLHMQRLIAEYEKRFEQILADAEAQEKVDAPAKLNDDETDHVDDEPKPGPDSQPDPIPDSEPSPDFDSEPEVPHLAHLPLTLAGYQQSRLEDYI